jgi:hypothetical protein
LKVRLVAVVMAVAPVLTVIYIGVALGTRTRLTLGMTERVKASSEDPSEGLTRLRYAILCRE